jgi:hypothetical protein
MTWRMVLLYFSCRTTGCKVYWRGLLDVLHVRS